MHIDNLFKLTAILHFVELASFLIQPGHIFLSLGDVFSSSFIGFLCHPYYHVHSGLLLEEFAKVLLFKCNKTTYHLFIIVRFGIISHYVSPYLTLSLSKNLSFFIYVVNV